MKKLKLLYAGVIAVAAMGLLSCNGLAQTSRTLSVTGRSQLTAQQPTLSQQYLERAAAAYLPQYTPTSSSITGTLTSRGSAAQQVQLERGIDYVVLVACDDRCRDLDLYLYDRDQLVDRDESDSAFSLISFTPPHSGSYRLEVKMVDCASDRCQYSLGVYRKRQ